MELKPKRQVLDELAPPGGPSPVVFYDASRLVDRAHAAVATGIDRIDLRFARAVLDTYGEDCHFLVRVRHRAVLADRALIASLIDGLECIWFKGDSGRAEILRKLENAAIRSSLTDIRPTRPTSWLGRPAWLMGQARLAAVAGRRRILGALRPSPLPAIAGLCEGKTGIYVTCSHTGLARRKGMLAKLQGAGISRTVAYIHDLIPIEYPEFTRAGQSEAFAGFLDELAGSGADFIANSHDTARRLKAHAAARGWPAKPVPVVYPGIEVPAADEGPANASGDPYFVIVGTIEPRKNHLMLLEIWRELAQAGGKVPHLHIVGKRGWDNAPVFDMLDNCPLIRGHVTEHNDMTDAELAGLLRGARALLFPSFAEGFGMPLAEAVAADVPVIASDLPVFREIAGEGITYVDATDQPGWRTVIARAISESKGRACDRQQLSFFGWENARADFLDYVAES